MEKRGRQDIQLHIQTHDKSIGQQKEVQGKCYKHFVQFFFSFFTLDTFSVGCIPISSDL